MQYKQRFGDGIGSFGKVICGLGDPYHDDHDTIYEVDLRETGEPIKYDPICISFTRQEGTRLRGEIPEFRCEYDQGSFEFSQRYVQAICGGLPNWTPIKICILSNQIVFFCAKHNEDGLLGLDWAEVVLLNPETVRTKISIKRGNRTINYYIYVEDHRMRVDEDEGQIPQRYSEITEDYEIITEL